MHCSVPIVGVPPTTPRTVATASRAAAALCSVRRASPSSACPASVSSTPRVVRRNSSAPGSRSGARTDEDSPDCARWSRAAARVTVRSSATATKCSRMPELRVSQFKCAPPV